MADDWVSFLVSIWPYLVGVGVFIGSAAAVLAVFQPWRRRQELRERVLNRVYDYAVGLGSHEPEQVLAYGPWNSIAPSDWDRLRGRKQVVCEALRTAATEFREANSGLVQHMVAVRDAGLLEAFEERLGRKYVDDHRQITWNRIGLPGNYGIVSETLFRETYPHLLRHLDDREGAWREVINSKAAQLFRVDELVIFLREKDPNTLERLYDLCTTHQHAKDGLDMVRVLDAKHAALLRQCEAARRALKP